MKDETLQLINYKGSEVTIMNNYMLTNWITEKNEVRGTDSY